MCSKTFGMRSDLQRHLKYVHEKVKDSTCETCGKVAVL
jgi:hypothetical protein